MTVFLVQSKKYRSENNLCLLLHNLGSHLSITVWGHFNSIANNSANFQMPQWLHQDEKKTNAPSTLLTPASHWNTTFLSCADACTVPVDQLQQLALNDSKVLILNNINGLFSLRILLMRNVEVFFWHASHLNNNVSLLPTWCQRILCLIIISVSKPWLDGNFAQWSKYKAAERAACFCYSIIP